MRALSIAATGMQAQQLNSEVIANNIANINTTGFKRSRAEFSDLLYQTERMAGLPARNGEGEVPEGAMLGLGVKTVAIRNLHLQGPLANTGNTFDLAINGRGWLQIQGPNGETLYTRAGALNKNSTGQIVTVDGYPVSPGFTIPIDATDVTVNQTGQIYVQRGNGGAPTLLGQVQLANFVNEAGLEPLGNNLYRETIASGAAVAGQPGDVGFGTISQRYLEGSNVDAVKEITDLISAQRSYEMNSKVVQAADEMFATVTKNIR